MADPFLGEIRIMSFTFAPSGWALCNGQLLPINQNQALFALLSTTYGGNGTTTFGLPNLQGRLPLHANSGSGYPLGQSGGEQTHVLSVPELPGHTHAVQANSATANAESPASGTWSSRTNANMFGSANPDTTMNSQAVGNSGQGQAHENMSPYLVLNFCIAVQGIYPPS